jgi:Protein of unknown function (DUF2855)
MPELRVRRDDLAVCELAGGEPPRQDVADGEARLRVERFALTTNNITYGVLGDQLGYWRRFPADDGWGRIPAWGYATVAASRAAGVAEGTRVFGFVPMASWITMRPVPHPRGFRDASPHSADLNPIYVQYLTVGDEAEDAALVWRPLFGTSVLLDLDLSENGLPDTVVMTSASSKTAIGLAHLLRERPVRVVGLTSPARRPWVQGLGLYDDVLGYGEALDTGDDVVLIDFAGDWALVGRLHQELGPALRRSLLVGYTHRRGEAVEPPASAVRFSAPAEIVRRGRSLATGYAEAWRDFAAAAESLLRIERLSEGEALVAAYRALLEGRADPGVAQIVALPGYAAAGGGAASTTVRCCAARVPASTSRTPAGGSTSSRRPPR